MTLQDIFDQLTSGELSQLSIGGAELGAVQPAGYPILARNVQLGLTALYKRFNLKEGRSTAALVSTQLDYPITTPGILKIERVLTDDGVEMPLNMPSDPDSLFTHNSLVLSVPAHVAAQGNDLVDYLRTANMTLVFRANHPVMDMSVAGVTPHLMELELPDAYTQALLLFVASRLHTPTGITGTHFSAGNNYFARYEAECKSLENEGVQNEKAGQESRLSQKGFV